MLNNGDLLHINVNEAQILDFVRTTPQLCPGNIKLFVDLALQFRTQEGEKVVLDHFTKAFQGGDWKLAGQIARSAPKALLRRNRDHMRRISTEADASVIDFYTTVIGTQKLDSKESHFLGRALLN